MLVVKGKFSRFQDFPSCQAIILIRINLSFYTLSKRRRSVFLKSFLYERFFENIAANNIGLCRNANKILGRKLY